MATGLSGVTWHQIEPSFLAGDLGLLRMNNDHYVMQSGCLYLTGTMHVSATDITFAEHKPAGFATCGTSAPGHALTAATSNGTSRWFLRASTLILTRGNITVTLRSHA